MRKAEVLVLALVVVAFTVSAYLYPQLPDRVASHWNAQGEVDGYMSRFWGVTFVPLLLTVLALFFFAIPRIDPLKANIQAFRGYYDVLVVLITLFMLGVHLQTLLWSLGTQISPNTTFPVALGLLFIYIGVLLGKAKRNWFIGIRTPWTLSSDRVWDKTHRLGRKLFIAAGVIATIGVFFQDYAVWFIVVPVVSTALGSVAYSYFAYQQEAR